MTGLGESNQARYLLFPLGATIAITKMLLGYRVTLDSLVLPFSLGIAVVLVVFLLLGIFFRKKLEPSKEYDLSTGPAVVAKAVRLLTSLAAIIYWWLICDGVIFLFWR